MPSTTGSSTRTGVLGSIPVRDSPPHSWKRGRFEMKRFCLLFYVFCLIAINAFASVTGSIGGTVTDATGGVIPGATVTAINAETGVKVTTKTTATGAYNFRELNVG